MKTRAAVRTPSALVAFSIRWGLGFISVGSKGSHPSTCATRSAKAGAGEVAHDRFAVVVAYDRHQLPGALAAAIYSAALGVGCADSTAFSWGSCKALSSRAASWGSLRLLAASREDRPPFFAEPRQGRAEPCRPAREVRQ
jgi:hypothetical protein